MVRVPYSSAFPVIVFLYLDPGTGSLALQLLLAALLTIPFMLKQRWRKVIGFLRRSLSRRAGMYSEGADDSAEPNPPQH
jgi:hypothetical protein